MVRYEITKRTGVAGTATIVYLPVEWELPAGCEFTMSVRRLRDGPEDAFRCVRKAVRSGSSTRITIPSCARFDPGEMVTVEIDIDERFIDGLSEGRESGECDLAPEDVPECACEDDCSESDGKYI